MKDPLTLLSQKLRREMTKEERRLWYCFLKTYPVRFHRQFVIDRYIVDFYCHQAKLVIELDGSQHYDPRNQTADAVRTNDLEARGLSVLRFSNLDINRRFQQVCETIDLQVKRKMKQRACFT